MFLLPHSKQEYSAYVMADVCVQPSHKCMSGLVLGEGPWCWLENVWKGLHVSLGQKVLSKEKPPKIHAVDSNTVGVFIGGRLYLL